MTNNPARDAIRAMMEKAAAEGIFERGFFGDGVSLMLHAARSGDTEHLAKHIEDGGALDDKERKFVADHLRGGARTTRRKLDQRIKEFKILFWVDSYMRGGMNEDEAIREVINDPDLPKEWGVNSEETIETYIKNLKKCR